MNKLRTERYAAGKYDVLTCSPYPRRVGHICGGNRKYLAECGPTPLGYFESLKEARAAIAKAVGDTDART